MKILFNNTCITEPLTGVGYYALNNLNALKKTEGIHIVLQHPLIASQENVEPIQTIIKRSNIRSNLLRCLGLLFRVIPKGNTMIHHLKIYRQNQILKKENFNVYFEPNFLLTRPFKPSVTCIHDLSIIRFPHAHPKDRIKYFKKHLKKSITNSNAIVTVSNFSKQEIIDNFKVDEKKIFVAYNSISEEFKPRSEEETKAVLKQYNLNYRKFILVVVTFEPRKNLKNICLAYINLAEDLRQEFPLVLCGASGWGDIELPPKINELIQNNQIRILNYLDNQSLQHLTSSARVSCYCSIYEGFGLPILEAMQSNTPIITSNLSAMKEVAGHCGMLVNPLSPEDICQAMQKILTNDQLFLELQAKGMERAKSFTAEHSTNNLLKAFEFAINNN